ncbi:HD domain-containing protein [Oscillospiraceae bacterium CM]|nr:HD domain-containing protein [Oscillospiraceae bacterium CM]
MNSIKVNLKDLLSCLSQAQDLVSSDLSAHHHQVAYLAYHIARYLKLSPDDQNNIILAGLLHDIGALAQNENLENIDDESPSALSHGYMGSRLLTGFKPLEKAAEIITFHHHPWKYNGIVNAHIPLGSHIIHIADRTCVLLDKKKDVLPQIPDIIKSISSRGTAFMPQLVDCLCALGEIEYIWLDLAYELPLDRLAKVPSVELAILDLDQILDYSIIFSRIIDYRSCFTAKHSAGVAKAAEKLAQLFGYSENECKMIRIAGHMHDLGKLAVSSAILEKPGLLTADEFSIVKCHPYYTYRLLEVVSGFETISKWAAYHHEKPNGQGYPFHLDNNNLPLGARIIAVSDVFTAISEDRPYRKSMQETQIKNILISKAKEHALCPNVVSVLLNHFTLINNVRKEAQDQAENDYKSFKADTLKTQSLCLQIL